MSVSCLICAQNGASCCVNRQIYLTCGDIARLKSLLGEGFYTIELPDPQYLEPEYDPAWQGLVLRPDGRIRVLKRTPEGLCSLLSEAGCRLPLESRPLICRLHPYMYTNDGILGIDATCPMSREGTWPEILERLNMPMDMAVKWHQTLYSEIYSERNPLA